MHYIVAALMLYIGIIIRYIRYIGIINSNFYIRLFMYVHLVMIHFISEFNSQGYFISKPVAGYLTDAIGPKGTLSNEVNQKRGCS